MGAPSGSNAVLSQLAIEAIRTHAVIATARLSQVALEAIVPNSSQLQARISQLAIEVVVPSPIAEGTGAITLGGLAASAVGSFLAQGSGSVSLTTFGVSASADLTSKGTGTAMLAGLVTNGGGVFSASGAGAITFAPLATAASIQFVSPADGAVTLGSLVVAARGGFTAPGTGSITLGSLSTAASATLASFARGAVTLGGLGVSAGGALSVTASGAVTLARLNVAGVGRYASSGFGQTGYHIYRSPIDSPIDYTTVVATTTGLSWTSPPISYPGTWKFGVRAFDMVTDLEERNIDAIVTIRLDASAVDISALPLAPVALIGWAKAGGAIVLDWNLPINLAHSVTGFHVYGDGGSGTVNYSTALATVPWYPGLSVFTCTLTGFTGGVNYKFVVRCYNGVGEEVNVTTVTVLALTTCSATVSSLSGVAIP